MWTVDPIAPSLTFHSWTAESWRKSGKVNALEMNAFANTSNEALQNVLLIFLSQSTHSDKYNIDVVEVRGVNLSGNDK